jgi:riboflavin kinase / FMN adenylyltransferase
LGTGNAVTIVHSLEELEGIPSVVTIGTFDGVHRGHQLLLETTVERARSLGVQSGVVTFEPIPAMVLRPDRFPGRICSAEEKLGLLGAADPDTIAVLSFDRELSLQTPELFMSNLSRAFGIREFWVGEAFALGKDRVGNVERLTQIGAELGFSVNVLNRVTDGDLIISSSAIRTAVSNGEVSKAAQLLGRPFRVSGIVIHGAHFGRTIGYPTANFEPPVDQVPLADGIYASYCWLPGESSPRPAMTYVGTRPTVNSGPRQIETNILDFEGDLYGRKLELDLVERLRPDEAFSTVAELISQLGRDELDTRNRLANLPATL